jgi:hypothetical protein
MSKNVATLLCVIGLFALAVFFARPGVAAWLPSAALILCGFAALLFGSNMANAEKQLTGRAARWLNFGSEPRPLKYKLWGMGLVIVGIAWLFQGPP